jgi:hypothetical protein
MSTAGYERLLRSLEMLASSADVQEEYLRGLGTLPLTDELALEFDDAYELFKSSADKDRFSAFISRIDEIDELFEGMSAGGNADLWTNEALARGEWAKIREIAKAALNLSPF